MTQQKTPPICIRGLAHREIVERTHMAAPTRESEVQWGRRLSAAERLTPALLMIVG
jgi:hypothetical protein